MANTQIEYQEVRFDVRDEDLTHAYVYIHCLNDAPAGIEGWHHKTFPSSMSILDIMTAWNKGEENPITWSLQAPKN